jgi:hypothetical protein
MCGPGITARFGPEERSTGRTPYEHVGGCEPSEEGRSAEGLGRPRRCFLCAEGHVWLPSGLAMRLGSGPIREVRLRQVGGCAWY